MTGNVFSRQPIFTAAMLVLLTSCAPTVTERNLPTKPTPTPSQFVLQVSPTPPPTAGATIFPPTTSPAAIPSRATPPSGAAPGDRWDSPADEMTLVFVPEGSFRMGASADFAPAEPDERPQREINVAAFWIDSTEVTFAMYELCLEDDDCSPPVGPSSDRLSADHPVSGVSWHQAQTYCRWAARELPSEAQWEKAARGQDGRRYPWGWIGAPESGRDVRLNFCDVNCPFDYRADQFDDGYARGAPVGSYPAGASPYGALDMAGNVWEWTADWYRAEAYKPTPTAAQTSQDEMKVRSIRGGSWAETTWEGIALISRASNRFWHQPERSRPDLGFRCAVGSEP